MKKTITAFLFLLLSISWCLGQTEEEIKKEAERIYNENILNVIKKPSKLDLKLLELLQDSGRFENGFKEGIWVEFYVDSSFSEEPLDVIFEGEKMQMDLAPSIKKETGEYIQGEKNGFWTTYSLFSKQSPITWNRAYEINYKEGIKHGEEIWYSGFYEEDQREILYITWENGIENGISKIYNLNYPFNLQQVFNYVDGQGWLREQYYESGQLQTKFTDTLVSGQKFEFQESYFEDGQLKQTGFFENGETVFGEWITYYPNGKIESIENYKNDELDGVYKYYHKNGQLWTEREYRNSIIWNISSNYDSTGKARDKGTLKNGTGSINVYDDEGNLTKTIEYVNGKEKD